MKRKIYKEYKALTKYIKGYGKLSIFQKLWFNILAPIRFRIFKRNFKEEYALIEKAVKNKKEGRK